MKYRNPNFEIATAAVAMLLALGSCSDEPMMATRTGGDNSIAFSASIVTPPDDDAAVSRSGNKLPYTNFHAKQIDGEDMYLISLTTNDISSSMAESNHSEALSDDELENFSVEDQSRASIVDGASFGSTYSNKHIQLYAYAYPAQTTYNNKSLSDYKFSDVLFDDNGLAISPYINGEDLTITSTETSTGSGTYNLTPAATHYWTTSSYRITFIGLFPSSTDYTNSENSFAIIDNVPKFNCAIEENVENQRDFLVAQTSSAGNGSTVNLPMKHIMAGVSVSLDNSVSGTITGVTFSGISTKGTYNIADSEWELSSMEEGSCYYSNASGTQKALNNDNGLLFMMIPQTLGESAQISITVKSTSGTTNTYTISLAGMDGEETEWEMGKTVNYRLSVNNSTTYWYLASNYKYKFFSWDGTPSGDGESLTLNGKTLSDRGWLRLKSYKLVVDGTGRDPEEAGCVITFGSDDNMDLPTSDNFIDYLVTMTADDQSFEDNTQISVSSCSTKDASIINTFKSQKYTDAMALTIGAISPDNLNVSTYDTEDMTLMTSVASQQLYGDGSDDWYWDLSKYSQNIYQVGANFYPYKWSDSPSKSSLVYTSTDNGGRNTANCYMIGHAGYYKFPCVYGNSLYQDQRYAGSYQTGASGYALGSSFPHARISTDGSTNNGVINNNWIGGSTGDVNIAYAKLLWTTEPDLIQNVALDYANHEYYVKFYVNYLKLKPANAVIAIYSGSNTIIWSWHIWITPWASAGMRGTTGTTGTMHVAPNKLSGLSKQYYIKRPLGYMDLRPYHYPERATTMSVYQENTSDPSTYNKINVYLYQREHIFYRNTCTYYQWGRKDPFPANIREETGHLSADEVYETKMCSKDDPDGLQITYYGNGNNASYDFVQSSAGSVTYSGTIQMPYVYYTKATGSGSNRIPYSYNYYDAWGCTVNDASASDGAKMPTSAGKSAKKTVYDPCPPGFRVPACLEMPAITSDGYGHGTVQTKWMQSGTYSANEAILYAGYINTPSTDYTDLVDQGGRMKFYCTSMGATGMKNEGGDTWDLYAMGQYDNENTSETTAAGATYKEISDYGQGAYYWTATSWASSNEVSGHRVFGMGVIYDSGNTQVYPAYGDTEFYGRPIIAIFGSDCAVYQ